MLLSSVQFSHSVVSDSLRPHGLQHTRPPCPSPALGIYSNLWPLSQWCHPTISSSVVPFSSLLQSFPASGSFQILLLLNAKKKKKKKKRGKLSYILWSIQDKIKPGSQLKVPKDVSWLYYESLIHWILYVLDLTFTYPLIISGKKRIILSLH